MTYLNDGWWNQEFRISKGEWLETGTVERRWYPAGSKIPTGFEPFVLEVYDPRGCSDCGSRAGCFCGGWEQGRP